MIVVSTFSPTRFQLCYPHVCEKFTAGLACSNKAAHAFVECGQKTENYGSDVHSYIFRTAEVTYIADGPVKRLRRVKTEKNVLALSLDSDISVIV